MTKHELGVRSICCLLHNLVPGGSARQWIHLLERHVQAGGRGAIVAPAGDLSGRARAAGIELIEVDWGAVPTDLGREPWPLVAAHDAAVVHWDHQVMHAFGPALAACGRAALVLHQAPLALARWFGDGIVAPARAPIDQALASPHATVLVRGEWHRRRFAETFGIAAERLRILPASIPLPPPPSAAAAKPPKDVLALMRLSPDKEAIARLAVELVRSRLDSGHACRLAIAGEGPWHEEAVALCRRRLPPGSWRLEPAPPEPIARLRAADLVVAQGLTTLEAAALGRPVVVARADGPKGATGTVLTPERYGVAAEDPFGRPEVSADTDLIWRQILALDEADLAALRDLVARRNSLEVASRALGEALGETALGWRGQLRRRL
jgi:hypothetical protein